MNAGQAAALKRITRTQLQSFAESYLGFLIAFGVIVIAFFLWLYYRDWRKKRGYERFLESKRPKQTESHKD